MPVNKTEVYSFWVRLKVLLRICLVLVPQLRGREVVDLIEEEWRHDSRGEDGLSRSAFFESFFQLADIWTPGIDGSAYAEFLKRLFRRITIKRARTKTGARMTKIRPKIVVKVVNRDLKVRQWRWDIFWCCGM